MDITLDRTLGKTLALCLTLLWAGSSAAQAELEFERCQLVSGAAIMDAECATLLRPENPAEPDGDMLELFVTRLPSESPQPEPDALTIIQGGPGMSSIDLAMAMSPMFREVRRTRDILVIDQRGTGRSNVLLCPQDEEQIYTDFDVEQIRQQTRACLTELGDNVRYYTTSVAVADLEAARAGAGYEQLTIYGVSYGTRVAQHYLRRYPERVRALILDGVADISLNLAGGEIARRSQQAFDRMALRCAGDTHCAEQLGDIDAKFKALRTRLQAEPVDVQLAHPGSGTLVTEQVGEQHLLAVVRLMPYATESLALLPMLIAEAHAGNYVPLAAQALQIEAQFAEGYAIGMNNSVVCTEDAPFLQAQDMDDQEQTFFGSDMADAMQAMCALWPRGPIDDDFREPFDSNAAALILSGENDPITPAENGERAHQMLSNSKHIVVPAHGHGVIGRGCVTQLAINFIRDPQPAAINDECTQRERALPFFMNAAGPTP